MLSPTCISLLVAESDTIPRGVRQGVWGEDHCHIMKSGSMIIKTRWGVQPCHPSSSSYRRSDMVRPVCLASHEVHRFRHRRRDGPCSSDRRRDGEGPSRRSRRPPRVVSTCSGGTTSFDSAPPPGAPRPARPAAELRAPPPADEVRLADRWHSRDKRCWKREASSFHASSCDAGCRAPHAAPDEVLCLADRSHSRMNQRQEN